MRYLLVLLGLMFANVAEAVIDCKTPPTCESLGYSKDNDPNCAKDGYMYCPFDSTYKKCVEHDCEKLGFTTDDKSSWCDKLLQCKTNESYTACLSAPREAVTCEGFTLSTCPANGICSECTDKNGKKFKLAGCAANYTLSGSNCVAAACAGYTLDRCPTGGFCSECLSGSTKKYNLLGCKAVSGYAHFGNTCEKIDHYRVFVTLVDPHNYQHADCVDYAIDSTHQGINHACKCHEGYRANPPYECEKE